MLDAGAQGCPYIARRTYMSLAQIANTVDELIHTKAFPFELFVNFEITM